MYANIFFVSNALWLLTPAWRNWQTQQTQNLPLATTYRFKSDRRHHLKFKAP